MVIDRKQMERISERGGAGIGRISLHLLAKPETVSVYMPDGEAITPVAFNCLGEPLFTKEQVNMYDYKRAELRRQNGGEYTPLKLMVMYESDDVGAPRESFDTVEGIRESLRDLASLNEMLDNRRRYRKAHDADLQKFLIFGHYRLDEFGQIWPGVLDEEVDDVLEWNYGGVYNMSFPGQGENDIPTTGSVCPCCGKELTIEDVKNFACVNVKGEFYHKDCWTNYRRLREVYAFTNNLMSLVYKDGDYTYELIPNQYWGKDYFVPWFRFHTPDGDIIIGWRKRVISIEWVDYKPFDLEELFHDEKVTKGKNLIHADGDNKAFEYLCKVRDAVNPDYKW